MFQFLLLNHTVARSRKNKMLKYNKYLSVVPIGSTWTCFKFSFHLINGEKGSLSEHGTKKKRPERRGWGSDTKILVNSKAKGKK